VVCPAFPLSTMSMAALLVVQQRGGSVADVDLPGSRLLVVLQSRLLALWCCGALPTAVLLAPLYRQWQLTSQRHTRCCASFDR
jgi:hypothetical protein